MSKQMSPSKLTVILSFVVVIIIGLGVIGFIYSRNLLATKASETAAVSATAASSNEGVQSLTNARTILDANKDIELKAANLASDSKNYMYQNLITSDIGSIAERAGVVVTGWQFPVSSSTTSTTGTTSAIATALSGGVKETTVDVSIKSPLQYDKLMAFIHYIEQNSNKMQISKVSITASPESKNSTGMVACDVLTISAYVR